jgi:tRNA pseudouridine32 synthase/23S rRNA pseudouridine746 synthase
MKASTVAIKVLYEHDDFIVVHKPINISVQNELNQEGILPVLCRQLGVAKLWLVHRLDKVTSGILILAKNANSAGTFGQLFEQKKIAKYYLAIGSKKPKKKQGLIKGGMKKVRDGKWMLDNKSVPIAITQFFSYGLQTNQRLFLVKPLTGKTHQIRVALKSLGSPILGDTLYQGVASDRTYLHAYGVQFTYWGNLVSICCPPETGQHFINTITINQLSSLATPWLLDWPKVKLTQTQ